MRLKKTWRARAIPRLLFVLVALVVASWGILNGPWYEEQRLMRMTPDDLHRELQRHPDDPRVLYYAGAWLNSRGRFTEADPMLRLAASIDPDSARYHDQWAQALLGSGLATAAFDELKQFVETHPGSARAHFLMGKLYVTQNAMQRARQELERAVALDPSDGESWAFLAVSLDALGYPGVALNPARKAAALRPDNADDHLRLASLLARSSQPAGARGEYQRALVLQPKRSAIHREYAGWLLHNGTGGNDPKTAEREAGIAVTLDPMDEGSHLTLGRALMRNGKTRAAALSFTRAAALAPRDPAPAQFLVVVNHLLENSSEMARWQQLFAQRAAHAEHQREFIRQIRREPDAVAPHHGLALLMARDGDVAGCVRNEARALRCAIDASRALATASNDLVDGGHASDALPLARRAVEISGASPAAHEAMGNVLLAMGHIYPAGKEYNKAASWRPEWTNRLKQRLARAEADRAAHPSPAEVAYREARRLESTQVGPRRMTPQVEALARRATILEPSDPGYLWYLLKVLMARRENDAAIQTANQLLTQAPDDGRAHAMLAVLLVDRARTPEELKVVDQHLEAAKSEPSVAASRHYVLGLLALQRKQGEAAVRELKEAARLDPNADVTYYKLAMAEQMAGRPGTAAQARSQFQQRQSQKRQEAEALGDIVHAPGNRALYERAYSLFQSHGLAGEAEAIRAAEQRRFTPGRRG